MRHGKKFNHLSRTSAHRKAMLANMASSLIKHKRVSTTVAKAKALRSYVEPLITKSKNDTTHSRRVVFSHVQDKETVKELFAVVAGKVAERPGGYTRIIKVGNRLGDNADMCIIELVDFNENLLKDTSTSTGKTRRSRRGGKGKSESEEPKKAEAKKEEKAAEPKAKEEVKTEAKADSPKAEEAKTEAKTETKEEAKVEATEEAKSEEVPTEEKTEEVKEVKASSEEKPESKNEDSDSEEKKEKE